MKKMVTLPSKDLKGATSVYWIEDGEVVINNKNKTFEATLTFGLADTLEVSGSYILEENILDDVLKEVVRTGRNAKYVG
ncbi:MAG: hypothetical protein R3B53_00370 [Candidatus Paceibacterota bacterium]